MIKDRYRKYYGDLVYKKGIYCIINIKTSKRYIGSTSVTFDQRFNSHIRLLRQNKHHSIHLQNSWNKYGEESFKFYIIKFYTDDLTILNIEQFYLNNLNNEYNVSLSSSSPMKGRKHSFLTLNKLRGKSTWNKGIKRTENEKLLMSIRKKEEYAKKDKEWYIKMSKIRKETASTYWLGKKVPEHVAARNRLNGKLKSIPIICLNTGKIYTSQLAASKDLKIKQGHISENIKGVRPSVSGFKFKKYENT